MIENRNNIPFTFGSNFFLDINDIKKVKTKELESQDATTTTTEKILNKKDEKQEKEELPYQNDHIYKEVFTINYSEDNLNKINTSKDNTNRDEEIQKEKEKKNRGTEEVKEETKIKIFDIKNEELSSKKKHINNNKVFYKQNNFNNNPFNRINNDLYFNNNNNIYFNQINQMNIPFGLNHNLNNIYNFSNNINLYINQKLAFFKQQINKYEILKKLGFYALSNSNNLNHYLFNFHTNNLNILYNQNNINPIIPFNNKINYKVNNINFNALQNPLNSCIPNHLNNPKNPEKYTIILKSKTDNPNVEKISKIKITTSYKKDNSILNKENNTQSKKEKNLINIDDILSGKENRTVVRLNPIPSNYSSFDVSKLLDKYLKIEHGKNQRIYKALYVPLCKIIGKNLGYCFIMITKPKYVVDFYNLFNGRSFGLKNCKKPCNVIWADIQGDEFLKLNEEDPLRKPIIFTDLRDD